MFAYLPSGIYVLDLLSMSAGFPQKTFQLDGLTYRTTVLSATDGRGLYLRLVQAIAPALETFAELKPIVKAAREGTPEAEQALDSAASKAIAKVLGGIDAKLFDDLCEAMGRSTVVLRVNGEDSLSGEMGGIHFAGKYKTLLQAVFEWCKANGFLDFLSQI